MKKKSFIKITNFISILIAVFVLGKVSIEVKAVTELISVGSKITVTTDTTVSDIIKVLGVPKVKTISPFGGYAYTFYTDDNYSNYLYIETTDEDKIISYGSVDKNYSVLGDKNNGSIYVEDTSNLSGYFYTDDSNKIIGGIYYNPSVLENGNTNVILNLYNTNFDNYSEEYQNGMARHAIPMYNALARRIGKNNINLQYSDAFGYYYNNFNESKKLGFENLTEKELVFSNLTTSVLNPMHFASMLKENLDKDYSKNNVPLFGYDIDTRKIYGYLTTKENAEEVAYKNHYKYYGYIEGFYDIRLIYALNLLDDNMTETEKALVLAQFTQVHDGFFDNDNVDYLYGREKGVDWYNKYFQTLATTAGLSCEMLKNTQRGGTWNICNLDDEWTYIDVTKNYTSFEPYHTKINFDLLFKSKEFIEKNNTLKTKYDFENSLEITTNFSEENELFDKDYPKGFNKQVDNYSSLIYYDSEYKYYEKSENNKTFIYKENRQSQEVEKLQEALYSLGGTGLVKDNNILYYVGTDNKVYAYDLKTKTNKNVASITENNKKITGVYLNEDGFISYEILDNDMGQITTENTQIRVADWIQEKKYYFDDNAYKYKLVFLETPKNIVIVDILGFGSKDPVGNIKIPDLINGKPVVGILGETISPNYKFSSLSGDFVAPKYLEYIGMYTFQNFKNSIKLNSKLKSIGGHAFYDIKTTDKLILPDSITYIGPAGFYASSSLDVKISSGLKYLTPGVFYYWRFSNNISKVIIPEGIEYIGTKAITTYGKAYFLPKSLIRVADALDTEEVYYQSAKTKYETWSTTKSYYITPDFKDTVSIKYFRDYVYINKEREIELDYEVEPKYYFDETILTWSSSNPKVATVDNKGKVNLKKTGNVTISLKSSNGGEASFDLIVMGLEFENYTYQLNNLNDNVTLNVLFNKSVFENKYLTWESNNRKVVDVDSNGNLLPKSGGFAKILVTSKGYELAEGTAECLVYVAVPIELSDGSKGYAGDLNRDGKIDAEDITIIENIIKENKITNDKILLGDINGDNILDSKDVELLKSIDSDAFKPGVYKPITKVTLDKTDEKLEIGKTLNLSATITPGDTTDSPKIIWSSSNEQVAMVDENGKVTGLKDGIAIITAKTSNGKMADCKVIVGTGFLKGDLNENGKIELADALEALYYYVGEKETTASALTIGDFDNNGAITVYDALNILNLYVNAK